MFPPIYVGPIRYVDNVSEQYGGGRDFVAERDIEAGTLLLAENPIVTFSTEYDEDMETETPEIRGCRATLEAAEKASIVEKTNDIRKTSIYRAIEELHPIRLEEVSEADRKRIDENAMIAFAKRYGLTVEEVTRVAFAVQCNCYVGGLCLHQSMLNHACVTPNCIKFRPSGRKTRSEVWSSRAIRKGESLTISYDS